MSEYIGYVEFKGQRVYPGSFVLLKNKRGKYWNVGGLMDRYLNRVVCIKKFTGPRSFYIYQDATDNNHTWVFNTDDIESVYDFVNVIPATPPYTTQPTLIPYTMQSTMTSSTITMVDDRVERTKELILGGSAMSNKVKFPKIIKFINKPEDRTLVVFFDDNTKAVARCDPADEFDLETGIEVCVMKKLFGNNYHNLIRKEIKSALSDREEAEKIKQRRKEEKEKSRRKEEQYRRKKMEAQAKYQVEMEKLKEKYRKDSRM